MKVKLRFQNIAIESILKQLVFTIFLAYELGFCEKDEDLYHFYGFDLALTGECKVISANLIEPVCTLFLRAIPVWLFAVSVFI
jgi:hypothetical protein